MMQNLEQTLNSSSNDNFNTEISIDKFFCFEFGGGPTGFGGGPMNGGPGGFGGGDDGNGGPKKPFDPYAPNYMAPDQKPFEDNWGVKAHEPVDHSDTNNFEISGYCREQESNEPFCGSPWEASKSLETMPFENPQLIGGPSFGKPCVPIGYEPDKPKINSYNTDHSNGLPTDYGVLKQDALDLGFEDFTDYNVSVFRNRDRLDLDPVKSTFDDPLFEPLDLIHTNKSINEVEHERIKEKTFKPLNLTPTKPIEPINAFEYEPQFKPINLTSNNDPLIEPDLPKRFKPVEPIMEPVKEYSYKPEFKPIDLTPVNDSLFEPLDTFKNHLDLVSETPKSDFEFEFPKQTGYEPEHRGLLNSQPFQYGYDLGDGYQVKFKGEDENHLGYGKTVLGKEKIRELNGYECAMIDPILKRIFKKFP